MTTTYRPIVTPAFMLADSVFETIEWLDDSGESFEEVNDLKGTRLLPLDAQLVHAARAEVLGELERIKAAWLASPNASLTAMLWGYIDALRASLDDPEEGSA